MAFTPVELTKNGLVTVANTAESLSELLWDGWVPDGATPATQDYFDQDMVQRLQNPASQSSRALSTAYGPGGTAGNVSAPTAAGIAAGLAIVFGA